MLIKRAADIRSSEITDKRLYLNRREFLQAATGTVAVAAAGLVGGEALLDAETPAPHGRKLENIAKSPLSTNEKPNTVGTDHHLQQLLRVRHRQGLGVDVRAELEARAVDGRGRRRVQQEGALEPRGHPEGADARGAHLPPPLRRAWSMVIPWVGFPLADFIKRCEPTSKAKYVEFTTLNDPKQMPGVRASVLRWPYIEGLRMDEAMHPLTHPRRRPVRRGAAQPERRAAAPRRAVEVRLQAHQVDRQDQIRREAAAEHLAGVRRRTSTASTPT